MMLDALSRLCPSDMALMPEQSTLKAPFRKSFTRSARSPGFLVVRLSPFSFHDVAGRDPRFIQIVGNDRPVFHEAGEHKQPALRV